jgi:hypothetical protein
MNEDELNFDELLTDVYPGRLRAFAPNRQVDEDRGCLMNDGYYRGYQITCDCDPSVSESQCSDDACYHYASVGFDVVEACENWLTDENGVDVGNRQKDYALRMAKTMAAAPQLLRMVKRQRDELFWLTNTMDDTQQKDVDNLKQRAVHPSIADFVQRLAEWGFNNTDNGYVWEAMRAVIEAGEKGNLDDLIACYEEE